METNAMRQPRDSRLIKPTQRAHTPPQFLLMEHLASRVDDEMLCHIAEADYGLDYREHLDALIRLRAAPALQDPLDWHPKEVFELTRWEELGDTVWQSRAARTRGHLMRAFSCMALMLSADREEGGTAEHGEVETLGRLVDSVMQLGADAERLLLTFLDWRVRRLPSENVEPPFFHFARLLLVLRTAPSPDPEVVVDQVRELLFTEYLVRTSSWAVLPPGDTPWLLGLTFFDQSHHAWQAFAHELAELAEQKLSGQAREEVRHVALRVGTYADEATDRSRREPAPRTTTFSKATALPRATR